jgi:hypothetical protein
MKASVGRHWLSFGFWLLAFCFFLALFIHMLHRERAPSGAIPNQSVTAELVASVIGPEAAARSVSLKVARGEDVAEALLRLNQQGQRFSMQITGAGPAPQETSYTGRLDEGLARLLNTSHLTIWKDERGIVRIADQK